MPSLMPDSGPSALSVRPPPRSATSDTGLIASRTAGAETSSVGPLSVRASSTAMIPNTIGPAIRSSAVNA